MDLTPELKQQIKQEIEALVKDDYLRPGMSFDNFVGEYSMVLGQATEDKSTLAQTGFDATLLPKYYGYMKELVLEHGARVATELEKNQSSKDFDVKMPEANKDRKLLMAISRYIVTRTEENEAKKVYDMVRKGHGDVDALTDNITLVSFLRQHKDLAQEVKPGGKTVDDAYLIQVEENALGLLKLRGEAIAAGDDARGQVDRQNRLMTLCINAQREIKLFAEMAFYDDTERYNKFYASATIRQQRKDAAKKPGQPLV